MFTATSPLNAAGSRIASRDLEGHTELGKLFLYSSCPSAIIFDFTESLSAPLRWLGNDIHCDEGFAEQVQHRSRRCGEWGAARLVLARRRAPRLPRARS